MLFRSWVSKGKDDVQKRIKKLSWFEKMVLRMNVCLHREHYEGYKERKMIISNQNKLFKELEKKRDKTPPPPPPPRIGKATGEPSEEESSDSEKTISYDAWHAKQFPWSDFDFEDVSSNMPSSSNNPVNTGKAPMVQSEIEEDDEASGSQYDEDDDDDATDEDSE